MRPPRLPMVGTAMARAYAFAGLDEEDGRDVAARLRGAAPADGRAVAGLAMGAGRGTRPEMIPRGIGGTLATMGRVLGKCPGGIVLLAFRDLVVALDGDSPFSIAGMAGVVRTDPDGPAPGADAVARAAGDQWLSDDALAAMGEASRDASFADRRVAAARDVASDLVVGAGIEGEGVVDVSLRWAQGWPLTTTWRVPAPGGLADAVRSVFAGLPPVQGVAPTKDGCVRLASGWSGGVARTGVDGLSAGWPASLRAAARVGARDRVEAWLALDGNDAGGEVRAWMDFAGDMA